MLEAVIVSLLVSTSGYSVFTAVQYQYDGGVVRAYNDNQVANALIWQSFKQHPTQGSCTLYEDWSLGGDCSRIGLDPDADVSLDGYPTYTSLLIDYD